MKCYPIFAMALIICLAANLASATDIPRTIDNDGPTQGVKQLSLEELWRVGGEDEDVIFGRITDLKMHPDGTLFVLDNQMCQVAVISPEGEYLQSLSREGDGPGEIRQPMGLVLLEDDLLGVGMGFPGKIVTMRLDGTPVGTHFPVGAPADGNIAIMISLQFVDGVLAASGGSIVFAPEGNSHTDRFVSIGDASMSEFNYILETPTPIDPTGYSYMEADEYYIDRSVALGKSGRIYAPMLRDKYEISEFDKTGKLVRVFGRKYQQRKRSDDEKSQVGPLINPGTPDSTDWNILDNDPCISRLMINPEDGFIWALTPHGDQEQPEDLLETWDVFTPEGEYHSQVAVPLGNEMNDGNCYLVGMNKMVVIRGTGSSFGDGPEDEDDEVEPLEVICYQMK